MKWIVCDKTQDIGQYGTSRAAHMHADGINKIDRFIQVFILHCIRCITSSLIGFYE